MTSARPGLMLSATGVRKSFGRNVVLEQEWIAHREALRAAGELPDDSTTPR